MYLFLFLNGRKTGGHLVLLFICFSKFFLTTYLMNVSNQPLPKRKYHSESLDASATVGTAMLPVVAFPFEDFYIDSHHMTHQLGSREQQILFYTGLLAAALGIGGIRAILCPMGAYNLQGYNQHQLLTFFNWWVMRLPWCIIHVVYQ